MKERFQKSSMILTLCIGIFIGATMVGGAAAAGVVAQPTWQPTYVDGRQVQMDAYNIGGYNYVKLRDIGKEVGFNVFWDNGVQVDTTAEYTGVKPADSSAAADTGNASAENNEVSSKGTNDPTGDMKIRLEIVQRINEVRAEHGMTALAVNESLMSAAQECSQQLFTYHHNRVECEAVAASGYPHGFGSNLTAFTGAAAQDIPQCAVTNWANSPGHLETMLNSNADCVGVGVTVDSGWTFCYMFVGCPGTINPYG